MSSFRIPYELEVEIKNFCDFNDLDVDDFFLKIVKNGFNIEKYGNKPTQNIKEPIIELEFDTNKKKEGDEFIVEKQPIEETPIIEIKEKIDNTKKDLYNE